MTACTLTLSLGDSLMQARFSFLVLLGTPFSVDLGTTNDSVTLTVVPEPGTALLMGLGLAGLGFAGRRE